MEVPVLKLEHADARGEIYSITLPGDQELLLIHSVAGSLRGGHAHDVSEVVFLLTGAMNYSKEMPGELLQEAPRLLGGDVSFNQAGQYHLGEFTSDSWLIEYKLNTKRGAWKNIDHPAWREKVRANSVG